MSRLQLSTDTSLAWGQWCYRRPSLGDLAPVPPAQPRPWLCWGAIKAFREHREVPQRCLREGLASAAQHTSPVLAELQLTSRDERHKTSAPTTALQQTFSPTKKGTAELPCAAVLRTHPGTILLGCPLQNNQLLTLIPPCCHHITSQKNLVMSAPCSGLATHEEPVGCRVRETSLHSHFA